MSLNNEARVLSALLKNKDMMSVMSEGLGSMIVSHKDIWEFIYRYYSNHKEVPPANLVCEEYPDFEYNENIEGATKHFVGALRESRTRAELELMMTGAAKALASGDAKASDLLNHFSKRIAEVQRHTGSSRAIDIRDMNDAGDHYDRVRELSRLHDGQPGIRTGFKYWDENYPTGFAKGHFGVVMGYSGHAKTWVSIYMMVQAWLQGYSPMIINLEMTPEELRDRIYFFISEYSMDDLVKANMDPDDFMVWARDFMEGKVEFHLIGAEGFGDFTTDMIMAKIEQYKPDIILCDYLQLFSDRARSGSEIEKAKRTAREFKQIAQAAEIPVVVITAVTGKDKKDRINPPEIAQVAWSSEIEYAANIAVAVHTHRDAQSKPINTEIVCRKNRHGPLFSFLVNVDLEKGTITEIEPEEQLGFLDNEKDPLKIVDEE